MPTVSVDSSHDELKGPASPAASPKSHFFSRAKKHDSEKPTPPPPVTPPDATEPVAFLDLFRFSTRKEIVLDIIGLVCAAGAGAAQPLMALMFGNLTQAFVNFGKTQAESHMDGSTPQQQQAFEDARSQFAHVSAQDASYLVYIGVGMFVATYTYMVIWVYTGEVNARRIRERYLRAVLRQDIAYFDELGAGEVATRIQTDTHLIQQGISEKVAMVVNFLGAFVCGFALAYARSWKMALALTSILPCIALAGAVMNRFVSRYMQMSLKEVAGGGSLAEEVISTVRTAQAFGTQSKLAALYDSYTSKAHQSETKMAIFHGGGLAVFFFVIYSAYALTFSFGTTLLLRNQVNVSEIVNVFLAILIGSFSLAMLAPEMQAITHARGAASKIFATIDRVPTIDSQSDEGLRPEHVEGNITFEHVKFDYPSRPDVPILRDLSISFPAGRTAALVGASGSGKSTIVSLVERFYDPLSGVVRLDGVDIKELNVRWLRAQIGLVSQEPTLFATTIRANVAQGLIGSRYEHASEEEKFALIKEACVKANADMFVSKLPLGYDTMVGERGFLLSGGQVKRIAIARAIVSDPPILLLDEATSALDTQSEGIVQNALDKASAGRTTITIAHRLSTVIDANCIYVMGDGRVLESGTHQELLKNPDGAYAHLVNTQRLRERNPASAHEDAELASPVSDEKVVVMEDEPVPTLERRQTTTSGKSITSGVTDKLRADGSRVGEKEYGMFYLFKRMGAINRDTWKSYAFGSVFATMSGMVYPVFGIVYGKGIEAFQSTGSTLRHQGDRNALWFFIIAIIATICIGCQNYLFARGAASLTQKLRSLTFKAILRHDIGWFDEDRNSTGALVSNLSDAPVKINGLAGITLGSIIQSTATIIGGTIIGLCFNWKLSLVAVACMPFIVSSGYIRLRVVVMKDQTNKVAHEESAQVACEAAGAIRTVASLTREAECAQNYSDSLEVPLRVSNRTAIWSNGFYALSQSMSFYVIALIFYYGSRLVGSEELDTFGFFVCLMSVTFGAIQAGNVFSFVPDISSAKGAATNILNLIDYTPDIDSESKEGKMVGEIKGEIRFEDVHFRYPTRPGVRILRSLDLVVKPGTYVALVGASGSGKSTVIQLMERFYDPLAGKITLDGQNIADLNIQNYREQLALVSQEPSLYAGSIRFNILLGAIKPSEEVTEEEIEAACRNANIWDFIRSLPEGLDTQVGGKGTQLSGGQKQRIAIARALLRNPKVLLLDEATSALDSQSEKVVQDALDKAARGRTTIAIAHRLSTIQNADCIYFLKDGRISESGTHDQLLDLKGGYYELVQLQALSKH
ncbi:hypothetical protein BOTBODRAFT_140755 [Botryobasidium botryosum FD-172 SS1]|uniref:P-loop containing nucleoside triphosphate hydrolase protein n=1 Tax=Botryobasidium botryosum (strain FD-172 SS1) TaxID=930990 RepID=A0A067LU35_BOTB1|nr:hypothetical protein BOTBODRAFT_140755 [Botryobasidium botryosum FD-172 SS1]